MKEVIFMTVIPEEEAIKTLDLLEERFMEEMADAKQRMAFIKEKRVYWQLITLRMLRKRLERLKVEIE